MAMLGRTDKSPAYRYGFNGKEKDENGEFGSQTVYDYGFRIYNPAIARFLSVDPLSGEYPWYTPYQFAGNMPISAIDLDGLEPEIVITNKEVGYTMFKVHGLQDGNLETIVVPVYEAHVFYTDSKGQRSWKGSFKTTRDGWYSQGTDSKGNWMLINRTTEPPAENSNKKDMAKDAFIRNKRYTDDSALIQMDNVNILTSPDSYFDQYTDGEKSGRDEYKSNPSKASGVQIHVGGYYIGKNGIYKLAGTYGCFGVVDPSQVSETVEEAIKLYDSSALANENEKPKNIIKPSNDEMNRVIKTIKENQKSGEKINVRVYNRKLDLNKEKKTITNTD